MVIEFGKPSAKEYGLAQSSNPLPAPRANLAPSPHPFPRIFPGHPEHPMEGVASEALERAWMFPGRSERGCGPKNWFAGFLGFLLCLFLWFIAPRGSLLPSHTPAPQEAWVTRSRHGPQLSFSPRAKYLCCLPDLHVILTFFISLDSALLQLKNATFL